MPGINFCRDCGAEFLYDPGFSSSGVGHSDYDPVSYGPSTLTTDGTAVPGEIADMGSRTGAWLITNVAVQVIGGIPLIGWAVSLGAFIWNLVLYQRGQDVGARITGIRVIRNTGELAGFYHMWTRGLAAIISFLAIGAGFWTAYSDRNRQTWHDKWMGTYVVKAGPEVNNLPGTSSAVAEVCFWISFATIVIVISLLLVVFDIAPKTIAGF